MKKSLDIFEQISNEIHSHTIFYKFNKNTEYSNKYRKGRVDASLWLNDLIFYYIKKENSFTKEFKEEIKKQKIKIEPVKSGDYKEGIYDQLNIIEKEIDDRINS